jgi:hypothetical protein
MPDIVTINVGLLVFFFASKENRMGVCMDNSRFS